MRSIGPPKHLSLSPYVPMAAHPSTSVAEARRVIADRLREILRDAGLTSRALARQARWDESKCSRLIHGRTPPSDDDIRMWCTICGAEEEIPNLIAASRNAENAHVEWRRVQRSQRRMQDLALKLFEAKLYRFYSSNFVLWPLQTPDYMRAVITRFDEFRAAGAPDIDAAVAARVDRLRFLDDPSRRCVMVMEEAALRGRIFDDEVMAGQLRHMLSMMERPNISLRVIPLEAARQGQEPVETFHIYDEHTVSIELVSAILKVTQPREIALYVKCFNDLARVAVHGNATRALITQAIAALR
jgi:transcriptional regulator with XRE-family HTH domain